MQQLCVGGHLQSAIFAGGGIFGVILRPKCAIPTLAEGERARRPTFLRAKQRPSARGWYALPPGSTFEGEISPATSVCPQTGFGPDAVPPIRRSAIANGRRSLGT